MIWIWILVAQDLETDFLDIHLDDLHQILHAVHRGPVVRIGRTEVSAGIIGDAGVVLLNVFIPVILLILLPIKKSNNIPFAWWGEGHVYFYETFY